LLKAKKGDNWHDKTGILFTTIEGKPMLPSSFNHWIAKFTETHGLPAISPHAFRHMAATYALDRGFDLKYVSNFVRHTQVSTTGDIYAHVLPAKNQQLVASLDEIVQKATQATASQEPSTTQESRTTQEPSTPQEPNTLQ
jgi:site-specific recombinase XerD